MTSYRLRRRILSSFEPMNFEEIQDVSIYIDFIRDSENPLPRTQILFKFTCIGNQVDWVKNEEESNDSSVELARTRGISDVVLPVFLDRKQVKSCFEDARKTLDAILVELPLDDNDRDELIRGALKKAVNLPRKVKGIGVGGVGVTIIVKRHRTYYGSRRDYDQWVGGEDQDHIFMTPTEDSAIESVRKRKRSVLETETCSICLENLPECSEGVSMPCNHLFHGDCIGKWLKASHYCPICRFKMPTARKI